MKVKNGDIIASMTFLNRINRKDISLRLSFKIGTIVNRAQDALKNIETHRQEIIESHHEKDKDGNKLFVDKENRFIKMTDEGGKKLEELMDIESNIDVEQIPIDELEAAGVTAQPSETKHLAWLIKV